jgi:uncharacterized protein (TIGR02466 family)
VTAIAPKTQLFELFPVPVVRVTGAISAAQSTELASRFVTAAATANQRSEVLLHTQIQSPDLDPALAALATTLAPHVAAFGELLFGERLNWRIKEMWANVLHSGGGQSVHNHANCFVSGVLYLTESDASARTMFLRGLGGRDFVFSHSHAQTQTGPFNAARWMAPEPAPGDLLLFPSYLLHEVPTNRGGLRVTLAFNAIPDRLDSWGYAVSFAP